MRVEQEIGLAGERLVLLPERAIYWPARQALLVADVHLGKDSAFRTLGVPIGVDATQRTLDRLSALVTRFPARVLYILGDLWHARAGRTEQAVGDFLAWRNRHAELEIVLIEGNHDRRSGCLPAEADTREVPEPFAVGPFALCHYPSVATEGLYRLAGHLHPGSVLRGPGRQALRLPCFVFGPRGGILPAFGEFTGLATAPNEDADSVHVIAEDRVIRVK